MKMKIRIKTHTGLLIIFYLLSFNPEIYSQSPAGCDPGFVEHLVNEGFFEEALYETGIGGCSSFHTNDSLNYLRGWALYSLNRLLPSAESFLKVSPASEFYVKSRFFAAYNYAHCGDLDNAKRWLSELTVKNDKLQTLKKYENSGFYLLEGNTKMFEESLSEINTSDFEISRSADNLRNISNDMINHKEKSKVAAGVMSALMPGSGKFYAGKKGEAISAFIATTGLGFVTWENYRRNGVRNFKTIAFGTAFAFSYAANIYGAVLSVKIIETEYRDNVKNSILFNLHIPLRNTFGK